jgi:preprotein translocase subunit SecD
MKNSSLLIRTAIIAAITLIGIYLVIGPRGSIEASDFTWQGIKNNVSENINLGLDLRGGSHLVMRVKTNEYLKTLTENNQAAAVQAAKEAQLPVTDGSFVAANNNYQVTLNLTDASQAQAVIDAVKQKVDFSAWSEPTTSGNQITWSLPVAAQRILADQAVTQAERIIESRINAFGVKEPTFARHGASDSGQLLLQMPGVDDPERVKN